MISVKNLLEKCHDILFYSIGYNVFSPTVVSMGLIQTLNMLGAFETFVF